MSSPDRFDGLADCIRDILDDDPECETITFHQEGCVSEQGEPCECQSFQVSVDEIHLLGVEAVARKLEGWL